MYIMKNQNIIEQIAKSKNLKKRSIERYNVNLKEYSALNKLSLEELLIEAENEEDERIRMRNRKIYTRLEHYKETLQNGTYITKDGKEKPYKEHAISTKFNTVKGFYNFFNIEVPNISVKVSKRIKDLNDIPSKKDVYNVITNLSNLKYKSIILLMFSSGMGSAEVGNLTGSDFVKATSAYHNCNNLKDTVKCLLKS